MSGDAGRWTKQELEVLPKKTIYVYDWFHLKNHIRIIFGRILESAAMNYVNENDAMLLTEMYQKRLKQNPDKRKHIVTIWNNWDAMRLNFADKCYFGTSAEGQVSHYCSKYFSSQPKAFSPIHLVKYAKLREYQF